MRAIVVILVIAALVVAVLVSNPKMDGPANRVAPATTVPTYGRYYLANATALESRPECTTLTAADCTPLAITHDDRVLVDALTPTAGSHRFADPVQVQVVAVLQEYGPVFEMPRAPRVGDAGYVPFGMLK